jgi:hypothetical protein
MKVECPRCAQSWVRKVHIGATGRTVYLCYECEACWFSAESIENATFVELTQYLERKGLRCVPSIFETFIDLDG